MRLALPGRFADRAGWQPSRLPLATIALHRLAHSVIAFPWFMGVVRTRFGRHEDRFLSTGFVGSGLPFLAMNFVAGAVSSDLLGMSLPPNSLYTSWVAMVFPTRVLGFGQYLLRHGLGSAPRVAT